MRHRDGAALNAEAAPRLSTGSRDGRAQRLIRFGLALVAAPALLTGAWALFAPASWYTDFTQGVAPPAAFGPYNEHFVQDIGSGYLGIAAVVVWAALRPNGDLVRGALLAFLVFTIPHLAIHLVDRGDLTVGGYVFTNVALGIGVVIAAWVWWLNERRAMHARPPELS